MQSEITISHTPLGQTIREYAAEQHISLGAAYRRVWEGRVEAQQILGRWLITKATGEAKSTEPGTD